MRGLIGKLKKEHKKIINALEEIKTLGLYSDAVLDKLEELKKDISSHFLKEDEGVFAVLFREAATNSDLLKLLSFFSKESTSVTNHICSFFKKYREKEAGFDFYTDCSRLIEMFKNLSKKEEEYLFLELEKVYFKTKV